MKKNQLAFVKEYKFDNPLSHKIDSIFDRCIRDCRNNCFHTFKYRCIYNYSFTNIRNSEIFIIPISDESLGLYELNSKLKLNRQKRFKFNQINKLTIKIYSNLQNINLCYYSKRRIPMCHRLIYRRISQNKEYIENFCNDLNYPFHFACRK